MKSLVESFIDNQYNKKIFEEYFLLESEEILNESFQSTLLTNLAKEIHKAEEQNREQDKKREEQYKKQGYLSSPNKYAKSFSSIFGPITEYGRYGVTKTGIQGIKWNEIKDEDFKLIDQDSKEFKKVFKQFYSKDGKGEIICCEPGSKIPVVFIKCYSKENNKTVYYFNTDSVKVKTAKKYSYQDRDLKWDEAMAYIEGLDCYFLEITDDMIKQYKDLHTNREESQKGIINYDEESLKTLLKKQQVKYKALAEKIRAEKLQADPNILFDEIKKTNDEVVALYKEVMAKPENMDQYFDLGNLMSYVSYAYESFYKSMKATRDAERSVQRAKEKGYYSDNDDFGQYDKARAREEINDAKEYVDKIRKKIKEIRENLK